MMARRMRCVTQSRSSFLSRCFTSGKFERVAASYLGRELKMSIETETINTSTPRRSISRSKHRKQSSKRNLTLVKETEIDITAEYKPPELNVDEDLGLECLDIHDIPQDMLFPGEYNVYLQERVKCLTNENSTLALLVEQRNREVQEMKCKLHEATCTQNQYARETPSATNMNGSADTNLYADLAACQVMDLTKQVCELTAQLEEQKAHSFTVESQLLNVLGHPEAQSRDANQEGEKKDGEIKLLTDKLHATSTKLFESRNRIQQVQQELKQAYKVLASEVGEGISVSDLVSGKGSGGGWRGRAQQIQLLQQRLSEQSERLRKSHDGDHRSDSFILHQSSIRLSEKERRNALEAAQQEVRAGQQQLSENVRKLDAARARVKVLESEMNSLKAQLQTLHDKGSRDDQLINVLQANVNQLEGRLHLSEDKASSELKRAESEQRRLLEELQMERQRGSQIMSTIEDRELQIKRLEKMLFEHKENAHGCTCRCSDDAKVKVENGTQSGTISPEVAQAQEALENLSTLTSENERKRLLKLIEVLNKRLSESRRECDKHLNALRVERQRTARLQGKIARLEFERAGSFSMTYRQLVCNAKKVAACAAPSDMVTQSKEELENKLEILQEEVLTLQTRISCVEQEKEEDLRQFAALLEETHTAIRGFQTEMKNGTVHVTETSSEELAQ